MEQDPTFDPPEPEKCEDCYILAQLRAGRRKSQSCLQRSEPLSSLSIYLLSLIVAMSDK